MNKIYALIAFVPLLCAQLINADSPNYYKVLGIRDFAPADEINRACSIRANQVSSSGTGAWEQNLVVASKIKANESKMQASGAGIQEIKPKIQEIKQKIEEYKKKIANEAVAIKEIEEKIKTLEGAPKPLTEEQALTLQTNREVLKRFGLTATNEAAIKLLEYDLTAYESKLKNYETEIRNSDNEIRVAKSGYNEEVRNACSVLTDVTKKAEHDKAMPRDISALSTYELQQCLALEETIIRSGTRPSLELIQHLNKGCPLSTDPTDLNNPSKRLVWPESWPFSDPDRFLMQRRAFYGAMGGGVTGAPLEGDLSKFDKAIRSQASVVVSQMVVSMLSTIPLPEVGIKLLGQAAKLKNMRFVPAPFGFEIRQGIGFTGITQLNNMDFKATVYAVQKQNFKYGGSLSLALPERYKISALIPEFKMLDEYTLPKMKLVFSNIEYTDLDGSYIRHGLNLVTEIELDGPLKMLNELKDKAKELKSIIVQMEGPIRLTGVIPVVIGSTVLDATIPIRLGVDLTKIKGMPKTVTDIIKQVTSDDIRMVITPPPLGLKATPDRELSAQVKPTTFFETGVRLVLTQQPTPISILGSVLIAPLSLSFGLRMKNKLELGYVAFGDAGIWIEFDNALMAVAAAAGFPFTGLFVNGSLDIGKQGDFIGKPGDDDRVYLKLGGGARISSNKFPDMVFEAEGANLQFGNLIYLYNQVAKKYGLPGEVPESKIPVMTIERVRGYMSLDDVRIANKPYYAGFQFLLNANLFGKRFGMEFFLRHKLMMCSGSGYIPTITINDDKGKPVVIFTGPGGDAMLGTLDDGPYVYFNYDMRNLPFSTFGIKMRLDIPPLGILSDVNLEYSNGLFNGGFEVSFAEFTVVFRANINPKKLETSLIRFGFKSDFEKFLSQRAVPFFTELKNDSAQSLADIDAALGDLSREIEAARKSGVINTQKEIDKTRATIIVIKDKIVALNDQCEKASGLKKAAVCLGAGVGIDAQAIALAAQTVYLEGLLKPGKEVIKSAQLIEDLTMAMSKAQVTKKSIGALLSGVTKALEYIAKGASVFKLTEAIGEIRFSDLNRGKSPNLVSLKIELNIPDMDPIRICLSNIQFAMNSNGGNALMVQRILSGIQIGDKPMGVTGGVGAPAGSAAAPACIMTVTPGYPSATSTYKPGMPAGQQPGTMGQPGVGGQMGTTGQYGTGVRR